MSKYTPILRATDEEQTDVNSATVHLFRFTTEMQLRISGVSVIFEDSRFIIDPTSMAYSTSTGGQEQTPEEHYR